MSLCPGSGKRANQLEKLTHCRVGECPECGDGPMVVTRDNKIPEHEENENA